MLIDLIQQRIKPYLTTQPIHRIQTHDGLIPFFRFKPLSTVIFRHPALKTRLTRLDVNERILEIPFVFQAIGTKPQRVLDIGCCESTVAVSLASLGHHVTGLDIRPYELSHPNLKFVQENICFTSLQPNQFDQVILLSTLEHIGLDTIYGKVDTKTSDQSAINQVFRVLKPGGKLLLTVPICQTYHQNDFMRWYDQKHLEKLLKKFDVVSQKNYSPMENRTFWQEVKPAGIPEYPSFGVTMIVAKKPGK